MEAGRSRKTNDIAGWGQCVTWDQLTWRLRSTTGASCRSINQSWLHDEAPVVALSPDAQAGSPGCRTPCSVSHVNTRKAMCSDFTGEDSGHFESAPSRGLGPRASRPSADFNVHPFLAINRNRDVAACGAFRESFQYTIKQRSGFGNKRPPNFSWWRTWGQSQGSSLPACSCLLGLPGAPLKWEPHTLPPGIANLSLPSGPADIQDPRDLSELQSHQYEEDLSNLRSLSDKGIMILN